MPADPRLNLSAWQWGHSLSIAPISTLGWAKYSISGSYSDVRRRNKANVYARCTCWHCRSFTLCVSIRNRRACLRFNWLCWFRSTHASCNWDACNCDMFTRTFSLSCWICSYVLSTLLFRLFGPPCVLLALYTRTQIEQIFVLTDEKWYADNVFVYML